VNSKLALYKIGRLVASVVPSGVARGIGGAAGEVFGRLPDYDGKKAVVASHMQRVLGRQLQGPERDRLVAEVFASYGRYWAESLRVSWLQEQDILRGVTTSGFEHVKNAVEEGRGLIIATPHLGSWEWGAACLVRSGFPLTVAVEPLEPPELFEWFAGFRRRLGMHVVPAGPGAGAAILRSLKRGSIVCLLSDRLVGDTSGVDVTFFGAKARLPAGPVVLALRSGAPLLAGASLFGERRGSSHHLVFRPRLELARTGRLRSDVQLGTQAVAAEIEELVRLAPTQWHLLQPNWPGDPSVHGAGEWARARAGELRRRWTSGPAGR
jgi:KDO2-lipid IV(A) lauroyltransferase